MGYDMLAHDFQLADHRLGQHLGLAVDEAPLQGLQLALELGEALLQEGAVQRKRGLSRLEVETHCLDLSVDGGGLALEHRLHDHELRLDDVELIGD